MPIKETYQNPGLEYDENMVCEDFLNMGMLPVEFYPGAPVPYRSQSLSSVGRKQLGTGFLTTMPTRPIMHAWPQEIWESTRLLSHTFRYCDQWIHSAVFYGPAKGAETGLRGKRFITGDFNQLHGLLQQAQICAKLGWTEAQVACQHVQK